MKKRKKKKHIQHSSIVNIHVELNRVIPRLGIKTESPGLNIPSGKFEDPTSTNNGQLPHLLREGAPPSERDGAAVVLPLCQCEVENQQKIQLRLRRGGNQALGFSDNLGVNLGSHS